MKRLLLLSLLSLLFACSKSDKQEPEPEFVMKAGYSYYRITNTTTDTINVGMLLVTSQNNHVKLFENRLLFPNEQLTQEVSTTNNYSVSLVTREVCYTPARVDNFGYTPGRYNIVDRRMLQINIIKCP